MVGNYTVYLLYFFLVDPPMLGLFSLQSIACLLAPVCLLMMFMKFKVAFVHKTWCKSQHGNVAPKNNERFHLRIYTSKKSTCPLTSDHLKRKGLSSNVQALFFRGPGSANG